MVALAAALAVLVALVAVDFVTRCAAAVLFVAVVAVRLAEVRVAAADFLTTLVVVSASRWIEETRASRTASASWRPVVSVALAERSVSVAAWRMVVQVLGGLLVAQARDQLVTTHGKVSVGLLSLVGRLDALAAHIGRDLLDLLGDLLDALDGPFLQRAGGEVVTIGSTASAGVPQPLDGQVGDSDRGEDGGGVGDGLTDVLDKGHD